MCGSISACGRCLTMFFVALIVFSFWVFISADYMRLLEDDLPEETDPPLVLETDRLPMISPDKKTIYVASEDGLPVAHNFILRNPSIPVEKIVYRKPGHNSTIHIYPIQRDALLATNHDFSKADLPGLCAFVFILIFTTLGMYILLCRDLCGCRSRSSTSEGSSLSCDTCFEFDPSIDLMDLDDPFDSESSSPYISPLKVKKNKKEKESYSKGTKYKIMDDELKQPLLIV